MSDTGPKPRNIGTDAASNAIGESLRLIIDTIPTMVWSVRPDGAVDFVNQRWLDYTGLLWRRKSKTQRAHFIPKTFHVSWKKWLVDMAAGKTFPRMKLRLQRADGEYLLVPGSHGASARRAGKHC